MVWGDTTGSSRSVLQEMSHLAKLESSGFAGFVPVRDLWNGAVDDIPEAVGVYEVLHVSDTPPVFLKKSTAGDFQGKGQSVPLTRLREKWVPGTPIIYIGKAGNTSGKPTLRTRIRDHVEIGRGAPVAHWGGRYIWQIEQAEDLLFCWKPTSGQAPQELEKQLVEDFVRRHGRLPFANLCL